MAAGLGIDARGWTSSKTLVQLRVTPETMASAWPCATIRAREDVALVGDEALAVALQVAAALQARVEEVGELLRCSGDLRVSISS